MTKHPDLFSALAAPFEPREVKVLSLAGRQLHYVTARTVMNRLDDVVGPENWFDSYRASGESSAICRLTIVLPDGRELTKEDAGGAAGMSDAGDDDKSQLSDAFKRAAVKFGVARYLYRDGVPGFVAIGTDEGRPSPVSTPSRRDLPAPASAPAPEPATLGWVHEEGRPGAYSNGHANGRSNGHSNGSTTSAPPRVSGNGDGGKAPTTGKALFGWCKDAEGRHQVGVLKYLNQWAKLQDFPGRMIDWDADQVALGYAEASRKLASL